MIWYNPNKGRLYCAIGKPGVIDVIDTSTMILVEEVHTEEDTTHSHSTMIVNNFMRFYHIVAMLQFIRKHDAHM